MQTDETVWMAVLIEIIAVVCAVAFAWSRGAKPMRRQVPAASRTSRLHRGLARVPAGGLTWAACATGGVSCLLGLVLVAPGLITAPRYHDDHPLATPPAAVNRAPVVAHLVPPMPSPRPTPSERVVSKPKAGSGGGPQDDQETAPTPRATERPTTPPTPPTPKPTIPPPVASAAPDDDDGPGATPGNDSGGDDRGDDAQPSAPSGSRERDDDREDAAEVESDDDSDDDSEHQ
jgi:hypothetical protein